MNTELVGLKQKYFGAYTHEIIVRRSVKFIFTFAWDEKFFVIARDKHVRFYRHNDSEVTSPDLLMDLYILFFRYTYVPPITWEGL